MATTRHEAAQQVNDAFKAADIVKKLHDPKCEGFQVEIDGLVGTLVFRHGTHAIEQRKDELARFRLRLVEELCARAEPSVVKPAEDQLEVVEVEVEETPKARA